MFFLQFFALKCSTHLMGIPIKWTVTGTRARTFRCYSTRFPTKITNTNDLWSLTPALERLLSSPISLRLYHSKPDDFWIILQHSWNHILWFLHWCLSISVSHFRKLKYSQKNTDSFVVVDSWAPNLRAPKRMINGVRSSGWLQPVFC